MISLLAGITSERKLAGLISLSGFLGLSDKIHLVRPSLSSLNNTDAMLMGRCKRTTRTSFLSSGATDLETRSCATSGDRPVRSD